MPYCTIESKIMMIVQGSECLGDTEEVTTDGTGEVTRGMGQWKDNIYRKADIQMPNEVRKGL